MDDVRLFLPKDFVKSDKRHRVFGEVHISVQGLKPNDSDIFFLEPGFKLFARAAKDTNLKPVSRQVCRQIKNISLRPAPISLGDGKKNLFLHEDEYSYSN